jgi:PAS domain S-box-containing protein
MDVVYECQSETSTGRKLDLSIASKPVPDAAGQVIGILTQAVDITALKQHERDARKSEARFRLIAQGVPSQMLLLDRDLHIEFANDVFLEASGWTAEAARGRHISEIVGEDRLQSRLEYYGRALNGEPLSYESTGAAGHQEGYFRFSYRPSVDDDGNVQGLLSLATDISERRRIELDLEAKQAELLRSNKDLEQFAYVASHDLKAPLRAIDVLVGWIQEELDGYDSGDIQDNLKLLRGRTQRLERLLEDLLAYSRAGRKVGKYGEVNCHGVVLDAVQLLDPPETMTIAISGELPTFETYGTPLEQVFRNLIGNAIKHHPGPHGHITVVCAEQQDRYVFAVTDDGAGIDPQYAERVFQMFQTLKPRDAVEGSGMGLAIVNRIVQWQGGRVWFEAGAGGRGTVFKFEWSKRQPVTGEAGT